MNVSDATQSWSTMPPFGGPVARKFPKLPTRAEKFTISDRFGRRHPARVSFQEGSLLLQAFDGEAKIGLLWCLAADSALNIHEFVVQGMTGRDAAAAPELHSTAGTGPENFRKLGIGTGLLRRAVEIGASLKFTELRGGIVHEDLVNTPGLPEWYRKRGFTVSEGAEAAHWQAIIARRL